MSAKLFVSLIAVAMLAMSFIFYRALQRAPEAQVLVADQLETEFLAYASKTNASDKMMVAETGSAQYFVSFKQPWNFELQEQNLVVTVPPLQRVPPQASIPAEDLAIAQKKLEDFVLTWLREKFPSQKDRKDMTVEIHFTPTSQ